MTSSFDDLWLKMGRAKQHIDDLEAAIIAFHRGDPYHIFLVEDDPEPGQCTVKVADEPPPIPHGVPLILGDAVHAMRSSLDYFAFAAVVNPPNITNVAFPVWRKPNIPTLTKLQSLVGGKVPGASKPLTQALCALQPYQGGHGEQIWLLDHLDLIDKHRLLVTIRTAYSSFGFDMAADIRKRVDWAKDAPPMPIAIRPAGRYPVQKGTPLFTAPRDFFEKHKDLQFTFDIAFGEPQILEGEPVVPALRRLLDEVDGLLKRLIPLV